jgi:hypothetical protein
MTRLIRTLLALAALGVTQGLPAQTLSNSWSKAGTCDAGMLVCDHVTVADIDDGSKLLQFTEYGGHMLSYLGVADPEDSTLIDIAAAYFDGHELPRAAGQCVLLFKAPGQLDAITCSAPSLTFTVTK